MIIAPVNAPPSQVQITQNSDMAKLAIGSPDLTATASLKKKATPTLQIAQAWPAHSGVLPGAETNKNLTAKNLEAQNSKPTDAYPKAQIMPSPLVAPKKPTKSAQTTPDTQLLVPDVQPESKEQQKPEQLMPETMPVAPDTKQDSKQQPPSPLTPPSEVIPAPLMPETTPVAPDTKQDSKQQPPPPLTPPSEVIPAPQQQNPLPSGPPPTEPGNYPDNTGPGAVYYNQNYIAPAISFGRDTLIGATSRFGIGKNISVRPSLFLGNSTRIAIPLTYDFGFNDNEQFEKNPLVVFHAGGGLDYSSNSSTGGSNKLSPLVVFGADVYLGDGASVLIQVGNTFNSDFVAVAGIGLQF